jgi:hypothetical protein
MSVSVYICVRQRSVGRLVSVWLTFKQASMMPPEMLDQLRPEFVSPVVAFLCHESTEETGGLFEMGAGWVAKLQYARAEGAIMSVDCTPEAVEKMWPQVIDVQGAPDFSGNTIPKVMAAVEQMKAKI